MVSDRDTDLRVHVLGRQDCPPKHSGGPAVRDCYLFHYILSGRGIYQVGGKTHHLSEGEGFLILPHVLTYYQADEQQPWSYAWLGVSGAQAKEFFGESGFSSSNLLWTFGRDERMEELLLRLSEYEGKLSLRHPGVLGNAYLFFERMMEITQADRQAGRAGSPAEQYVHAALEYMEGHYHEAMSIAEVAQHVGLDRNYLGALFKKQLGRTMQQCLIDLRMNKACELLTHTDIRIADVARSVGYADQLQFSKAFRARRKVSPLEYRRSAKENSESAFRCQ